MHEIDKNETDNLREDLGHARQALRDATHAFDTIRSKLAAAVQCPPDATWAVITATVEALGTELAKVTQQLRTLDASLRLIAIIANLPVIGLRPAPSPQHSPLADVPPKEE